MNYYQNLDLDKIDKQQLNDIITKIKKNKCCLKVEVKDSSSKGYHVLLVCDKMCDLCRFVFDDQKRYEIDLGRNERFKNVIFERKEYCKGKGKMPTKKHLCEKCLKYGNSTLLSPHELTIQEVKQKMKKGKIFQPVQLVYLFYTYLECPICHWFKFVKKYPSVNIEGHNEE